MCDPDTLTRLRQIPDSEWELIIKQLVLYTSYKLNNFGFQVKTGKDTSKAEDFAMQAIEKVLDGTRSWDFRRFPDLLIHLKGVVKSLISSHLKTSSKSSVVKVGNVNPVDEAEDIETVFDLADDGTPAEIIITDQLWKQIEKEFGDDQDEFIIFCDYIDGRKPRDVATEYGKSRQEIYNILKRGRRIITRVFN